MKKNLSRIISAGLTLTMVAGCAVVTSAATKNDKVVIVKEETAKTDSINIKDFIDDNSLASKHESVYIIADSTGSPEKIIVSELLKNYEGADSITDASNLENIVNTKTEAGYTLSGDSLVWDAKGEQIHYQGTSNEQLPVTFKVSFKLDGNDISADDIAGKSGKLEMTIDYTNNTKRTVSIDGKDVDINVPFLMISGMILDKEKFSNITVENGRLLDEGSKQIVIGYALPGVGETLMLGDTIKVPTSVTISADVKDFELSTILSVATNSIFNKITIPEDLSLDSVKETLGTIKDGLTQLASGTTELATHLNDLISSSESLVAAIKEVNGYAGTFSESVDKLYNEAVITIGGKLTELTQGLTQISGNSATLNGGAKQVFDSLLNNAQTQIAAAGLSELGIKVPTLTITNYAEELKKIETALSDTKTITAAVNAAAKQKVTAEVEKNNSTIVAAVKKAVKAEVEKKVKDGVKAQVLANVIAQNGITMDIYKNNVNGCKALIDAGVTQYMNSAEGKAMVSQTLDAQMASKEVKATIDANVKAQKEQLIASNLASKEVKAQIDESIAKAKAGAATIKGAREALDSYNEFYNGVLTYTAAVDTAATGSVALNAAYTEHIDANIKNLNDKLKEFAAGTQKLYDTASPLTDGVTQLANGASQIAAGVAEIFDGKLAGLFENADTAVPFILRAKAMLDCSKEYQSYGGISKDMTGETKFLYRTESIAVK